ncbi:MAG TPA: O-antigen ligase family protein [Thermoanaerobaculia bacterium]|jgi:O-antigen ligase
MESFAVPSPTRAERLALRVVQLGAIAVVLAASLHRTFDLDRFLVPKELALHATAALAGLFALPSIRRSHFARVDLLLIAFVGVSIAASLFAANPWLAFRAVAVSASSLLLFWTTRALREAGLARPLLSSLAFAIVLAAATSLAQAYGLSLDLFSINRVPGGTLGNRNFVAHAAAFGLPVVLLAALHAQRAIGYLAASCGAAFVTAALVLTRSRAAWLAFGAVVMVFLVAIFFSSALRRDGRAWRRLLGVIVIAGAGVAAALLLPNDLRWRSDNPYLESVQGMANYQEGSGRGRLIQYERSLRLAASNPLLGVGPGNWPVAYPEFAKGNDPSMDQSEDGMTSNPWPSSDWVAYVAERGPAAALLLAIAFLMIVTVAFRRLASAVTAEDSLQAMTLLGTLIAAGVAGAFDAVLLLALPSLFVWTALGVLWTPLESRSPALRSLVAPLLLVLCFAGAARSTAQLIAMEIYAASDTRSTLEMGSRIDPGNYRLRLRLARGGKRNDRCEHALAARGLYPNARAARNLARGCE